MHQKLDESIKNSTKVSKVSKTVPLSSGRTGTRSLSVKTETSLAIFSLTKAMFGLLLGSGAQQLTMSDSISLGQSLSNGGRFPC